MMTELRLPTIVAGTGLSIGRWFKRTGDAVTLDELIVEINAGEETHEGQAPVTGVLSTIVLKDGASVGAGAVLGANRQF